MKLYYKVIFGYNQHITIEGKDLVRAMYSHVANKTFVSESGMIDGKLIQAIIPNYNKTMGWNDTYKITADDENEISKLHKLFDGKIGLAKEYVVYCLDARQKPDLQITLPQVKELLAGYANFAEDLKLSEKVNE